MTTEHRGAAKRSPEDTAEGSGAAKRSPEDTAEGSRSAEGSKSELPTFMQNFNRTDWYLYAGLMVLAVYSFALIPFRAMLLLKHPVALSFLTGSNFALLSHAARSESMGFIALMVVISAVSMVKFLPLYFFIGKRWGKEFINQSFGGYPPRWFQKIEHFIYARPGISFLLSFIPFSPISFVIVTIAAGVARAKGWVVAAYVLVFSVLHKCFYAYLGITFGTEVQDVLTVIDRYVTWITLVLLAYMFYAIWRRSKKGGAAK